MMEPASLVARVAHAGSAGSLEEWLATAPPAAVAEAFEELLRASVVALRADLDRAEALIEAAVLIAERRGGERRAARARRGQANVLHFKGEYRVAQELYDEAVSALEALGDALEAATTRSSALVNLSYLGETERLEKWAESARRTFVRHGHRERLAALESNLGGILYRRDEWRRAREHFEVAVREFESLGRPDALAAALRNLAVCETSLLAFDRAVELYERARSVCEREGFRRLLHEIGYNEAYLRFLRGDYQSALELYEQTRARCDAEGDRYHRALCDLDEAEIHLELERLREAEELAESAQAQFAELGMRAEEGKALALGAVALARAGQPAAALRRLDRAKQLLQAEGSSLWSRQIDLHRAFCLWRLGREDDALSLASTSVDGFEAAGNVYFAVSGRLLLARILMARHTAAARAQLDRVEAHFKVAYLPALRAEARLLEARLAERGGDLPRAERCYLAAGEQLEVLRYKLAREDLRISFFDARSEVYEALFALAYERGDLGEALRSVQLSKSRSLSEQMLGDGAAQEGQRDDLQSVREQLRWCYRELRAAELLPDVSPERMTTLLARAAELERRLLTGGRVETVAAGPERREVSLERLFSALGSEETTLVEYFAARGRVYGLVLRPEGVTAEELTDLGTIRRLHRMLHFQLSKQRRLLAAGADRGIADQAVATYLKRLYDQLLAPLAGRLETERVVVLPHGSLHSVPFHALWDGSEYVVDRHIVSYAPSASVLCHCAERPACCSDRVLILGVPDARTPYIGDEVDRVAARHRSAHVLLGSAATLSALTRLAGEARVVHLATHGYFRRDSPMFSALQLGDTRLSLLDLYRMRINADLVVLSACDTGVGFVSRSDEAIGLPRGFLRAGARKVLASLWDVNDQSTAMLMDNFYESYLAGADAAVALRRAMMAVRDRHPQPFFWAPFALIGASGQPSPSTAADS